MIKIFYENKKFANHIEYSFESLFRCVGIKDFSFSNEYLGEEDIVYGHSIPKDFSGVFIGEGLLFSDVYLTENCIPQSPVRRNTDGLLVLYESIIDGSDSIDNTDIVQGTFFILTGIEEIVYADKSYFDKFGRFKANNRILYKEEYLYKPIVNEYAESLAKALGIISRCKGPVGVISHDLDLPFERFNFIGKVLNKLNIPFNKKEDPYIEYILEVERKMNIFSSWYVMTANHSSTFDGKYDIRDSIIKNIVIKLRDVGCEIGLHYGFGSIEDNDFFKAQCDLFESNINFKLISGRNHYLRYKIPDSFLMYSENGILYDSTLGSAEEEGFVFGTCTPFKLFDAVNGIKTDVWELPLIVMEATLFQKSYKGYSFEYAFGCIERLVEQVVIHNGCFTMLWHNSSFEREACYVGIRDTYEKIMRHISDKMDCLTGVEAINRFVN